MTLNFMYHFHVNATFPYFKQQKTFCLLRNLYNFMFLKVINTFKCKQSTLNEGQFL
jgi:hypothetical protein